MGRIFFIKLLSVVVHNFHLKGTIALPDKTKPPLIDDS